MVRGAGREPRIVVVGAGPSGLAASFQYEAGFTYDPDGHVVTAEPGTVWIPRGGPTGGGV